MRETMINEPFFKNEKIKEALKSFLDQTIIDLIEISTEEQQIQLMKTKLVFDDEDSCYTSGSTIVIGSEFPYFHKENYNLCYRQVQAAILHELAHNFLTNFKVYQHFVLTAPQKYGINVNIAKTVINIFEDYRIERRMQEIVPFGKKLFFILRTVLINKLYLKAKENVLMSIDAEIEYILNSMLYIGFAENFLETSNSKVNNILTAVKEIVLKAKYSKTTQDVSDCATSVMEILLKNYDGEMVVNEDIKTFLGKLNEKGTRTPNENDLSNNDAEINNDRNSKDGKSMFTKAKGYEVADITKNLNEATDEEFYQTAYRRLLEDINNEDITAQIINEYLYFENEDGDEEISFSEIEKIKQSASGNLKTRSSKLIVEENVNLRYSDIQYQKLKVPLQAEIDQTVLVLREIKEDKENSFEEQLKYGNINNDDLYKFASYGEMEIFQQPLVEEGDFDMEVMLLIDESGSNSSLVHNTKNGVQMERYKLNRLIAIFLHEVLREMKWKHTIWTFHTQNDNEVITPLLDFEESLDATGLNFANIYARGCNRDGYHIRVAGDYLEKKANVNKKLLIVLSDGQPNAPYYNGQKAINDVRMAVDEVTETGISVMGIFSGSPEENKYFERSEDNQIGMYEKAIFMNNDKLFEFKETFKQVLIEFYEE